jgi:hypothetical protein
MRHEKLIRKAKINIQSTLCCVISRDIYRSILIARVYTHYEVLGALPFSLDENLAEKNMSSFVELFESATDLVDDEVQCEFDNQLNDEVELEIISENHDTVYSSLIDDDETGIDEIELDADSSSSNVPESSPRISPVRFCCFVNIARMKPTFHRDRSDISIDGTWPTFNITCRFIWPAIASADYPLC